MTVIRIPPEAGGGTIEIQDEGTPLGPAGTLNVKGATAAISVVGGVADLDINAIPGAHASTHETGGGTDVVDHNKLNNLTVGDPHTQYWNSTRGVAAIAAQRPTRWIEVDPGLTPSLQYQQYSSIAAGLAAADALVLSLGEPVGVRISGLMKPVGTMNINGFVTLEFESGSNIDFSAWVGGGPLFQMKGVGVSLINPPLSQGFVGAHPFTGGNWIEVIDDPALLTLAFISGMLFWDNQGGATRAIQLDGTAAANQVNLFVDRCNISALTTAQAINAVGNARLTSFLTKVDTIGEAIRLRTDGVTHAKLALNSTNYIYAIGGNTIHADAAGNVLSAKGSFFDLGNTTGITVAAGDVTDMLNSDEIYQRSLVNADYSDPEDHSLNSALEELKLWIAGSAVSPGRGHAHTGSDSQRVAYSAILNHPGRPYQARRAVMVAGSLVYFLGMNSSNGIKLDETGVLVAATFTNDNSLTRDLKIWKFDESGPTLTLLRTITLSAERSKRVVFGTPDTILVGEHLIAGLEAGTGSAANANLVMEVL